MYKRIKPIKGVYYPEAAGGYLRYARLAATVSELIAVMAPHRVILYNTYEIGNQYRRVGRRNLGT